MLHDLELAQRLATLLTEAGATERAFVMQMPGWPSRTPSKPAALAIMKGQLWHILAAVDIWDLVVSPPPALARFAGKFAWWQSKSPDVPRIAAALTELSRAWWQSAPEAVGVLDVMGAVTNALTTSLGTTRGFFGNLVDGDRSSGGRAGTVGRWPNYVDVGPEGDAIAIVLATPTGGESLRVSTVHDLAAALPQVVATLHATDEACAAWLAMLATLKTAATQLAAQLPGTWTTSALDDIVLAREPLVVLSSAAAIGGTLDVHLTSRRAQVGEHVFELGPDLAARIAAVLGGESKRVTPARLVEGQRYRVVRAFKGAAVGDILRFRQVTEIKPSGADAWFFVRDAAPAISVSLTTDAAADRTILDALHDYLE